MLKRPKDLSMRNPILAFLLATFAFIGIPFQGYGQVIPAPLSSRIANAKLIVEGRIIESESFVANDRHIYSRHKLEVQQTIKGEPNGSFVEIVLQGGTVDGRTEWLSHHLYLQVGDKGVFFLIPSKNAGLNDVFDVYSDLQGFIRYKTQFGNTIAGEPFKVYPDINKDLFSKLPCQCKSKIIVENKGQVETVGGPVIDSIRPLEVSAGTRSELRIFGKAFLENNGKVYFRNSDDGGATYMDADNTDIQIWNDSLIVVYVPSVTPLPNIFAGTAGSGNILIETQGGDSTASAEILKVNFAIQNERNDFGGVARYGTLIDHDSNFANDTSGGYTFHFSSSLALSDSAETAFRKAIRAWRCATGVDFKIGTDTNYNVAKIDTFNIVKWDDGPLDNLPANVLARTIVNLRPCNDVNEQGYFADDIDFIFSRNQDWNFDTLVVDTTKWDFYSIALHEIGHGHLLYHVIDPQDVMHHSLDSGQTNRDLLGDVVVGGNWLMDSSEIAHGVCPSPMVRVNPLDCNTLPISEAIPLNTGITIFPNPSSGTVELFSLQKSNFVNSTISLFDLAGKKVPIGAFEIEQIDANHWRVDFKSNPNGLYLIQIQSKKSLHIARVILNR